MACGCQAGVEPVILTTMQNRAELNPTELYATIKLGIDAHAKCYDVARQVDGATPQPVLDGLFHFVAKQQRIARGVFTCYESSGAR